VDRHGALQRYDRQHDPARVLALSDGVFAILITLLVLEIHVPELSGGESLPDALREIRPSLVAFVISFLVIAIAWVGHRDLFGLIRRTDRNVVWLNLLYLFPLCLLPFGAALLARYDREAVALQIYGGLLLLIVSTRLVGWLYVTNRPYLLFEPVSRRIKVVGALLAVIPAALYLVAIRIADAAPEVSLLIYGGVPVLYFLGLVVDRSTEPPGAEDAETFT
jgi:uncharacterized membrane protein